MERRQGLLRGYAEAVGYSGLSERTIRRAVQDGLITVKRVGPRLVQFDAADLDRYLDAHVIKAPARRKGKTP